MNWVRLTGFCHLKTENGHEQSGKWPQFCNIKGALVSHYTLNYFTFGVVLDKLDPTAADDQKYNITYSLYDGSSGEDQFKMIKKDGAWVDNN